ncbi:Bax inhibitor-1/YccA family protein [Deinococcus lacus]|uniref:Bax inhibitor-1/YccA family protein n=1 Tax=Deinococcus lacus TaxID=392561 RepID=A0ABW1YEB2_9DEIO
MTVSYASQTEIVRGFLARTYSWMSAGLALTAGVAYMTAQNEGFAMQVSQLYLPLVLLQFGLVMGLSFLAPRLNSVMAGMLFIVYAAVTGLTFSSLLYVYSPDAVISAFLSTAGAFGLMSAVGYFTKRDLSGMGQFFLFALLGLFVAMIVNLFMGSGLLAMLISGVGVLLFAGLTAYDTQKLKALALSGISGEDAERAAVHGALALYLDFINMFLFILRFFGIGGSDD